VTAAAGAVSAAEATSAAAARAEIGNNSYQLSVISQQKLITDN
jgi:hypothetical protein